MAFFSSCKSFTIIILILFPLFLSNINWRDQCNDYYRFLGVSKDASTAEIRKGWHQSSLLLHPDKQRGLSYWKKAMLRFKMFFNGFTSIEDAFVYSSNAAEVLMDPVKRREHDIHIYKCREGLKSQPQHNFQGGIARNVYSSIIKAFDKLGSRLPFMVIPVFVLVSVLDSAITYYQLNGAFKSFIFLLFILFIIAVIIPMVTSIAMYIIKTPFRIASKTIGLDARAERLKAEGLKRARERQVEQFTKASTKKKGKKPTI